MGQSLQELKWAENETVFRQANEGVVKSLATTKAIAAEESQQASVKELDEMTLLFYCECANENCRERIALTVKEYNAHHHHKGQFILISGHHKPEIERIVADEGQFIVVQKYMTPPKGNQLNKT